jgi:predicted NodU family carbamoyl transferase
MANKLEVRDSTLTVNFDKHQAQFKEHVKTQVHARIKLNHDTLEKVVLKDEQCRMRQIPTQTLEREVPLHDHEIDGVVRALMSVPCGDGLALTFDHGAQVSGGGRFLQLLTAQFQCRVIASSEDRFGKIIDAIND